MRENLEQLLKKKRNGIVLYLSLLTKVWLTYQLNTRVKGYVGMPSLLHVSKVEPDIQEAV